MLAVLRRPARVTFKRAAAAHSGSQRSTTHPAPVQWRGTNAHPPASASSRASPSRRGPTARSSERAAPRAPRPQQSVRRCGGGIHIFKKQYMYEYSSAPSRSGIAGAGPLHRLYTIFYYPLAIVGLGRCTACSRAVDGVS